MAEVTSPLAGGLLPWADCTQRALDNGWTREALAALPFSERFDLGTFRPAEPRIPNRQKDIHDLFAGKTYEEIRHLLEQFIGPAARPESAKENLRRLRRNGGLAVTACTQFAKVVSRVEEWSHKMLESGAMLESIIQQITEACAEHGLHLGDERHVPVDSDFGQRLAAIVADNEHIGINAMQRAALTIEPMGIGMELLLEMRGKISQAGQVGAVKPRPPALLLGQYQSYFEETRLRQLPPETLAQLARSLGLAPKQATAAGIHRQANHRFTELRSCSTTSTTSGATTKPTAPSAAAVSGPAAPAPPPAAVSAATTPTCGPSASVWSGLELWEQIESYAQTN